MFPVARLQSIPELGFVMQPGTLGGLFTTIEGLLLQVRSRSRSRSRNWRQKQQAECRGNRSHMRG